MRQQSALAVARVEDQPSPEPLRFEPADIGKLVEQLEVGSRIRVRLREPRRHDVIRLLDLRNWEVIAFFEDLTPQFITSFYMAEEGHRPSHPIFLKIDEGFYRWTWRRTSLIRLLTDRSYYVELL